MILAIVDQRSRMNTRPRAPHTVRTRLPRETLDEGDGSAGALAFGAGKTKRGFRGRLEGFGGCRGERNARKAGILGSSWSLSQTTKNANLDHDEHP